jgi:CIC family chloride channel protein
MMSRRDLVLCLACTLLALPVFGVARLLLLLIDFFTNLFYRGSLSVEPGGPGLERWGWFCVLVPALGGLIVGLMARYGSKAIRGHGIPEAMEQVLVNDSRIGHRVAWLKPLSSAISIGSGGPFGAEGPIIATGAALGSLSGQWLPFHGRERKLLLAAGAAAGMAAIFGTPLAAVLLALELLLFEFTPQAILAVGLASATAAGLRAAFLGAGPVFPMPDLNFAGGWALALYAGMGVPFGFIAVGISKAVYFVEEGFEKLPLHWMFWPVLGGLAVGFLGMFSPRTLGVGYANISDILGGGLVGTALAAFMLLKFLSWSVALGSGTSGGTLAPLLSIGSALGYLGVAGAATLWPGLGLDPRLGALAGMAALFAGCSGAVMASLVFAFEATHQVPGVLPLLLASLTATATAKWLHPHNIMTEKLSRRGVTVPHSWGAPLH